MIKKIYTILFVLLLFSGGILAQTQIIINEFSQGDPGTTHEWIELVVTADGTNIQGVYIDKDDDVDNNGNVWDDKHVQLSTTFAPFANVSKGAIIVIYRNEDGGLKDPTLPADDIIFTDDNKLIIPHNDTNGFLEPGATWGPLIGTGDAFGIFNADGTGIHGVAYGTDGNNHNTTWATAFPSGTSWGMTDLTAFSIGSGQSAHFGEGDPSLVSNAANWVKPVPYGSATPGDLNGGNNNALPVELVSFSAVIKKSSVMLNWKTETEVNNYGFEINRSENNEDWKNIGFIEGNGNSNSPKEYSFTDDNISKSGIYKYRLKQIDNDGTFEFSKIVEVNFDKPAKFELKQNYPNPFNPSTTINFTLSGKEFVTLKIYNIIGEEVRNLQNGILEAGTYSFNFNAEGLPSGIYVYRLSSNNFSQTMKMTLLK